MFQEISNKLIIDTINRVSTNMFGGGMLPTITGNNCWVNATLPFDVGDGEAQPRIYLRNKNDGRSALMLGIGYFRIVCMNGMIVPGAGYSARIIHRSGPKLNMFIEDLEANIRYGFESALTGFDGFKQELQDIKLSTDQGLNIIGWLPADNRAKAKAFEFWVKNSDRRPEDQGYTAWQLYNLINEFDRIYSRNSNLMFEREKTRVEDILLLSQEYSAVA